MSSSMTGQQERADEDAGEVEVASDSAQASAAFAPPERRAASAEQAPAAPADEEALSAGLAALTVQDTNADSASAANTLNVDDASAADTLASTDASSSPADSQANADHQDGAANPGEEQRYEPTTVVGNGVYGTVFLARDRETGEQVALKRLRIDEDQVDGVPAHVIREVSLLRDFVHPNIVQLKNLEIAGPADYNLIFEYIENDLYRILKSNRREGTQLPMELVAQYSSQLLSGIHACHVRLIIHRDLKPQNILIHPTDGLKICDFGLARIFSLPIKSYTKDVITLWYRGPELLLGQVQYGPQVDIWSAGCIVAEMATGYPTFPGDSEIGTIFKIMQLLGTPTEDTWPEFRTRLQHWSEGFPRWPPTNLQSILDKRPDLPEAGMGLIRRLLVLNPDARLGSRAAKTHPFDSLFGFSQQAA